MKEKDFGELAEIMKDLILHHRPAPRRSSLYVPLYSNALLSAGRKSQNPDSGVARSNHIGKAS